jgi:D-alanine-D-alanine ligase-like ATP-grasp enzyme
MKGENPVRIQQAVRQAQMETDFLILLVFRTNSLVLDESRSVWPRILGMLTMIFNGVLKDRSDDLEAGLREAAAELFALPLVVERIQGRYFQGECILAKDVMEGLDLPVMFLRYFIADLIDSDEFRSVVEDKLRRRFFVSEIWRRVECCSLSALLRRQRQY